MPRQASFRCRNHRRGYAPLEFLLVLFPVILFFVMLLWMAAVAVQQPFAIIAARNDAWDQRFDQKAEPFEMSSIEQGRCFGEAERPIRVSHLVDDAISPRAEHVVFGGTWDTGPPNSPHVDLNQFPNLDLYKKTATKAGENKIQEIREVEQGLRRMIEEFNFESLVQDQVRELVSKGNKFAQDAQGAKSQLEQRAQQKLAEAKAALEKNKKYVEEKIVEGKDELKKLETEFKRNTASIERWTKRIEELEEAEKPDQKLIDELQENIEDAEKRNGVIKNKEYPNLQKAIGELEDGLTNLDKAGENFAVP